MLIIITILILTVILISLKGARNMWNSDFEEETITTTTESFEVVGKLKRQKENKQFFVIDPVDKSKVWLNSNDDMYEDADGEIWKLI